MAIFVGFKENKKPEIFEWHETPSKESHPQYDFSHGSFKTIEEAQAYVQSMCDLVCTDPSEPEWKD
jgi:hypothetical protein